MAERVRTANRLHVYLVSLRPGYEKHAPIPASSGHTNRHRLNKGGNRRLNHAIHMIVLTQARRTRERAPTSNAVAAKGEPDATPCARSNATYPTSSTNSSAPTPASEQTQSHDTT